MKHNIFFGSILIGTVFIYSCTQESLLVSTIDEKEITQLKESHFVSLEEALQIAEFQNNPHAKGSVINEYLEYQNNGDLAVNFSSIIYHHFS